MRIVPRLAARPVLAPTGGLLGRQPVVALRSVVRSCADLRAIDDCTLRRGRGRGGAVPCKLRDDQHVVSARKAGICDRRLWDRRDTWRSYLAVAGRNGNRMDGLAGADGAPPNRSCRAMAGDIHPVRPAGYFRCAAGVPDLTAGRSAGDSGRRSTDDSLRRLSSPPPVLYHLDFHRLRTGSAYRFWSF